jgi:perosamine synthetase
VTVGVGSRIPLSVPVLGDAEREYLQECIEENWIAARGRFVPAFEQAFADYHGRPDAVSAINGTAALHLAMLELGLGPGDEVIVPALTFVATANAVRYVGATPVFADVDPDTYGLTADSVAGCIGAATRAILVVHLYGHPVDLDPILELARAHELWLVEDATEALGSRYRGKLCGTLGDVACFSFNGNKVMTSGGGGMLLARDDERLSHLRYLTLQAREPGKEYLHNEVGYNYALSNVHAAIGLAQFERLDELLKHRRRLAERYAETLADTAGLTFCREAPWATSNFWLMSVLVDPERYGESRDKLMERLDDAGVDSRPFFHPIPLLLSYSDFAGGDFPTSRRLHARGLSIPSSADLDEEAQDRVIELLRRR